MASRHIVPVRKKSFHISHWFNPVDPKYGSPVEAAEAWLVDINRKMESKGFYDEQDKIKISLSNLRHSPHFSSPHHGSFDTFQDLEYWFMDHVKYQDKRIRFDHKIEDTVQEGSFHDYCAAFKKIREENQKLNFMFTEQYLGQAFLDNMIKGNLHDLLQKSGRVHIMDLAELGFELIKISAAVDAPAGSPTIQQRDITTNGNTQANVAVQPRNGSLAPGTPPYIPEAPRSVSNGYTEPESSLAITQISRNLNSVVPSPVIYDTPSPLPPPSPLPAPPSISAPAVSQTPSPIVDYNDNDGSINGDDNDIDDVGNDHDDKIDGNGFVNGGGNDDDAVYHSQPVPKDAVEDHELEYPEIESTDSLLPYEEEQFQNIDEEMQEEEEEEEEEEDISEQEVSFTDFEPRLAITAVPEKPKIPTDGWKSRFTLSDAECPLSGVGKDRTQLKEIARVWLVRIEARFEKLVFLSQNEQVSFCIHNLNGYVKKAANLQAPFTSYPQFKHWFANLYQIHEPRRDIVNELIDTVQTGSLEQYQLTYSNLGDENEFCQFPVSPVLIAEFFIKNLASDTLKKRLNKGSFRELSEVYNVIENMPNPAYISAPNVASAPTSRSASPLPSTFPSGPSNHAKNSSTSSLKLVKKPQEALAQRQLARNGIGRSSPELSASPRTSLQSTPNYHSTKSGSQVGKMGPQFGQSPIPKFGQRSDLKSDPRPSQTAKSRTPLSRTIPKSRPRSEDSSDNSADRIKRVHFGDPPQNTFQI